MPNYVKMKLPLIFNSTGMQILNIIISLLIVIGFSNPNEPPPGAREKFAVPVDAPEVPPITMEESPKLVESTEEGALARCLTVKGVKMYGAFWCSHCENQKTMFKEGVEYLTYIECDERGDNANPQACEEAEVTGFPTWIFANGERLVGEQPLEKLAETAGCEYDQ
jgi:glutaredoxin